MEAQSNIGGRTKFEIGGLQNVWKAKTVRITLSLSTHRGDQDRWVSHMKLLLRECQEACQWFMEKMAADEGKYLK